MVDTDIGARVVVEPGQPGLRDIVDTFGSDMLLADGSLDRAAMRQRIFRDATAREQLGRLLHPRIAEWAQLEIAHATGPYCVLVVPLLVETGRLLPIVHRVLVVDAPETVQIARLCARDAVDSDEARRALAAQASREQRLAVADDVIDNSGASDEVDSRVVELHAVYLRLALERHEG